MKQYSLNEKSTSPEKVMTLMIQTNPLDIYVTPAWQETVKTSYFCQAQPQLQLQLNWAGLALVLLSTPTRPPTQPQEK